MSETEKKLVGDLTEQERAALRSQIRWADEKEREVKGLATIFALAAKGSTGAVEEVSAIRWLARKLEEAESSVVYDRAALAKYDEAGIAALRAEATGLPF